MGHKLEYFVSRRWDKVDEVGLNFEGKCSLENDYFSVILLNLNIIDTFIFDHLSHSTLLC